MSLGPSGARRPAFFALQISSPKAACAAGSIPAAQALSR